IEWRGVAGVAMKTPAGGEKDPGCRGGEGREGELFAFLCGGCWLFLGARFFFARPAPRPPRAVLPPRPAPPPPRPPGCPGGARALVRVGGRVDYGDYRG